MSPLRLITHLITLIPVSTTDHAEFVRKLNNIATRLAAGGSRRISDVQAAYAAAIESLPLLPDASCSQLAGVLMATTGPFNAIQKEYLGTLSTRSLCAELLIQPFDTALSAIETTEQLQFEYTSTLKATVLWTLLVLIPFAAFVMLRSLDRTRSDDTAQSTDLNPATPTPQEESKAPTGSRSIQTRSDETTVESSAWYRNENSPLYKTITRLGLLGLVAAAGAWGAFLNIHLTSQGQRASGVSPPFFKVPIMGALFGFIMFLLFASRLVEGRIFPTSQHNPWQTMIYVPEALLAICLWALIGGFAQERVSRVLSNLAKDFEKRVERGTGSNSTDKD